MSGPRPYLFLAALAAASSCGGPLAAHDTAATATPAPQAAPLSTPMQGAVPENCDKLPLTAKEACHARQSPKFIAECERTRLYSCAPYARMYALEEQLKQLNAAFLQAAHAMYASYTANDPDYLKDLDQSFVDTDHAWRAYRDAHCTLEPLSQGMSRGESGDLTEACRADKTAARVNEMKAMLSILKEETNDEQRKP